jgi:hypothetical protein
MEEMLRALQEQFGGKRTIPAAPEPTRPPSPAETKRERLRREQEEIMARYREQHEASE